jgi:hypothetical protein
VEGKKASHHWIEGLKFKTKDGRILTEAAILSEAKVLGDKADDLLSKDYCSKPAAASAFPAPQPGSGQLPVPDKKSSSAQ